MLHRFGVSASTALIAVAACIFPTACTIADQVDQADPIPADGRGAPLAIVSPTELAPGWQQLAAPALASDDARTSAIILSPPSKFSAVFRQGTGYQTVMD